MLKKHVKLTECKRCAHRKFRNDLDRKHHFATSDFHPYCLQCRSGFRGLEEYCAVGLGQTRLGLKDYSL